MRTALRILCISHAGQGLTLYNVESVKLSSMIRIGEFAKMAGVSVAALRLYSAQGLLIPAEIDEASGYRYYDPSQLVLLHRIGVLKSLGFTLREIRAVLHEDVESEALSSMLALKRQAAEERLQIERQKVKRLELQIQIIQGMQNMTLADVKTLTLPEIPAAAIHLTIPTNDQAGDLIGEAFCRLYAALGERGITPQGSCMTVWESDPDTVVGEELDVVVPIAAGADLGDALTSITLPSELVASVTHKGPFSEFQTCHIVLKEWMAANRFALSGRYREIYHTPPGEDSVTEVQYPINAI